MPASFMVDDAISSAINIEFPFSFYCQDYAQLCFLQMVFYPDLNGFNGLSHWNIMACLGHAATLNIIALAWDDLSPTGTNDIIRYFTVGSLTFCAGVFKCRRCA